MSGKTAKIIELIKSGFTNSQIEKETGYSKGMIRNIRCSEKKKDGKEYGKWVDARQFWGVATDREIAEKLNVGQSTVTTYRNRHKIPNVREMPEAKLQKEFTDGAKCKQYVRTEFGIIDVLDEKYIYEVKVGLNISKCSSAVGQLLLYKNAYPNRELVIVTDKIMIGALVIAAVKRMGIEIIELKTNVTPER